MKIVIFAAFFAVSWAVFVPPRPGHKQHLLGEKECTYGPSYWCQNLTNAADCHATKHCIQTVWIHKHYPEDNSNICDTCKEMVKEARDQLESNETQELIKEVFEGSCALLRLKPIVEECDKIADEYIPDLIDTLASQMNPQTVCAVAGLCNNPRIPQLIAEAGDQLTNKPKQTKNSRCDDCNKVMDIVVDKFKTTNRDDFLESLLEVCGGLSSFADSCSNIVISNFEDIYSYLQKNLNAGDFCLLSGECYTNFHKHEVEITPMSKIGFVPVNGKSDDLPCELCEQLVTHLREVLIANTTEAEFKLVLEGVCKQTKQSFRKECVSIVDQYYDIIYQYIVNGLNSTTACEFIKICPQSSSNGLIAPLLPVETAVNLKKESSHHAYIPKDDIVVKIIQPKHETPIWPSSDMQLPIDLLVPPHQQLYNQQFCVFCEYFLHYVQNEISDPAVENDIKKVIDKACSKLPKAVNETCVEFVNTYEPALVAILAQEIDPSVVCPLIKACPADKKNVEIFMQAKSSADCPLCLYAITELESMVKGKKTKDEVKTALDSLCDRLSDNLKPECTDFVNTYTDELIEMLVADFKPQEVCVFLKLCTDSSPASEGEINKNGDLDIGGDTRTNTIFDDTVDGKPIEHLHDEKCVLCEFIMKEIEDELKDKKTDDEIKNIVHGVCKVLPGTIKDSCNKFVDQYADAIIILLQEAMDPSSICSYLKFCKSQQHPLEFLRGEVSKCGVCRSAAEIMQTVLKNPKIDQTVEHIFDKTCRGMSPEMKKTFISQFYSTNGELNYISLALVMNKLNQERARNTLVLYGEKNIKIFQCPICRLIVKGVWAICKGKRTRAAIDHSLHEVCKKFPWHLKHSCRKIVDRNFHKFADLMVKYGNDKAICKFILLCVHIREQSNTSELSVEKYDHSNGEIGECVVCKTVVKVLKETVNHSFTTENIQHALSDGWNTVFTSQYQRFLRKHLNQLIDLLTEETSRGELCQLIKVCPIQTAHLTLKALFDTALKTPHENEVIELDAVDKKKGQCLLCKAVVSTVKTMLKSGYSKEKIREALSKVCGKLHKFGSKCQHFVNQYMGQLIDLLMNAATRNRVCEKLKLCSEHYFDWSEEIFANKPAHTQAAVMNMDTLSIEYFSDPDVGIGECLVCKAVVKAVKEIVKHSFTRDKIKHALSRACNKVHIHKCQSFIKKHFNQLIDLLSKGASRGKVCRLIKVCSIHDLSIISQDFPDSTLEQLSENDILELDAGKKKGQCLLCKAVVSAAKGIVKSDHSKGKIREALTKVCGKLHKFGSKCQHFVNQYMSQLIDLLMNAATRNKVCRKLKLCSEHDFDWSREISANRPDYTEAAVINIDSSSIEYSIDPDVEIGECLVCKAVVKAVKEIVKQSFTRDKIKHALNKSCNKVHIHKCQSFIKKHFNQLIDLLSKGASRGRVCRLIKVCSIQDSSMISEDFPKSALKQLSESEVLELDVDKKKGQCLLCKAVVSAVKGIIKSDHSKEKIRVALTKVCSKLHKFGSKCQHFVNQYMSQLIDLLMNVATRNKVCGKLKLCSEHDFDWLREISANRPDYTEAAVINIDSSWIDHSNDLDVEIGECLVCKAVVKAVKEIVKHSFTRDKIKHALSKACNKVHIHKCQSFIKKHFNQLIDLLSKGASRSKVCRLIKVCFIQDSSMILEKFPDSALEQLDENEVLELDMYRRKRQCLLCGAAVSAVKGIVTSDDSKHKINEAFYDVCIKLYKFAPKCQYFFSQYLSKLDDYLSRVSILNDVCEKLKPFSKQEITEVDPGYIENLEDNNQLSFNTDYYNHPDVEIGECLVCKAVVKVVKEIVKHSFTRDKIRHALSKACNKVHMAKCNNFVKKHLNQLIDLLSKRASRGKVCRLIRVCSIHSSPLTVEASLFFLNSADENSNPLSFYKNHHDCDVMFLAISKLDSVDKKKGQCVICKAVVSTVKAMVKSGYSKDKIRDALSKVCGKLRRFGSKCQQFVNQYMGQLIDLLVNAATRNKVCGKLKLCSEPDFNRSERTNNSDGTETYRIGTISTFDIEFGLCDSCILVLNTVKNIVKSPHIMNVIHLQLNNACGLLPGLMGNVCHAELNAYWSQLINTLKNINEHELCHTVWLCSSSTSTDERNSVLVDMNLYDSCKFSCDVLDVISETTSEMKKWIYESVYAVCEACRLFVSEK